MARGIARPLLPMLVARQPVPSLAVHLLPFVEPPPTLLAPYCLASRCQATAGSSEVPTRNPLRHVEAPAPPGASVELAQVGAPQGAAPQTEASNGLPSITYTVTYWWLAKRFAGLFALAMIIGGIVTYSATRSAARRQLAPQPVSR